MKERIMACIPPNPRRVGYIGPIHGPLDGPLYMGSIYSNNMIDTGLLHCLRKQQTTTWKMCVKYHNTKNGKKMLLAYRGQESNIEETI